MLSSFDWVYLSASLKKYHYIMYLNKSQESYEVLLSSEEQVFHWRFHFHRAKGSICSLDFVEILQLYLALYVHVIVYLKNT